MDMVPHASRGLIGSVNRRKSLNSHKQTALTGCLCENILLIFDKSQWPASPWLHTADLLVRTGPACVAAHRRYTGVARLRYCEPTVLSDTGSSA